MKFTISIYISLRRFWTPLVKVVVVLSRKQYKRDTLLLQTTNKKSYMAYRNARFPVALSDHLHIANLFRCDFRVGLLDPAVDMMLWTSIARCAVLLRELDYLLLVTVALILRRSSWQRRTAAVWSTCWWNSDNGRRHRGNRAAAAARDRVHYVKLTSSRYSVDERKARVCNCAVLHIRLLCARS